MIWLNGEPTDGHDGRTVVALLAELGVEPEARGVAVAVNAEVVPRAEWPARTLAGGEHVEVLNAMQGG